MNAPTTALEAPAMPTPIPATFGYTNIDGIDEKTLILIEGQTLEEYVANTPGLKAPANGEVALMGGVPIAMDEVPTAEASIMVGKMPVNG